MKYVRALLMMVAVSTPLPACAARVPQTVRWQFDEATYRSCLAEARQIITKASVRGDKDVLKLVLLDEGARCLTAQGVDAIDGQDLITLLRFKCCIQYLKARSPMKARIVSKPDMIAFPTERFARCIAAVRARHKVGGNSSVRAAIALLEEGNACAVAAHVPTVERSH